jgi:hypothetical protein
MHTVAMWSLGSFWVICLEAQGLKIPSTSEEAVSTTQTNLLMLFREITSHYYKIKPIHTL